MSKIRAKCKGILTSQKVMVWLPIAKAIGYSDVATTLRYYVDACPVQKSKILYGVFPEDLE